MIRIAFMKKEILRVQKLFKYNDGICILDDLYLNLYEGDVLGIIGLHDSGKSLLLKILSGNETWDSGDIYYDEKPISAVRLKRLGKIHIIRSESALVPTLSVLENTFVINGDFQLFIRWKNLQTRLKHYYSTFAIDILHYLPIAVLSPAQRHLVEIMKAYIHGAKVILLDNIMVRYTADEHETLRRLIHQLKQNSVAFIITGYNLTFLRSYSEWIQFLDKGSTVKIFRSEDTETIDENSVLLNKPIGENSLDKQKVLGGSLFEARNISTQAEEDISFQIRQGEIAVILDLKNTTIENITKIITGNVKYNGAFSVNGRRIRNFATDKDIVYTDNYTSANVEIKSLSLKENLCLTVYPRISHCGIVSWRQKNQITKDFLSIYQDFGFQFNMDKLSAQEAIAIYLYRALIQNWKLMLCANAEMLFSYETVSIIKQQLRRMTENGRTICFLASSIEPYSNLADFFYLIEDGQMRGRFSNQELHDHLGFGRTGNVTRSDYSLK